MSTQPLALFLLPTLGVAGCTVLTGDGTDTAGGFANGERHHPAGYAAPEVHGTPSNLQAEVCTDCHGTELEGGSSEVGCDECHADDWRTDCTYCHGGDVDTTGAPPRNIRGQDDDAYAHVAHASFDCAECHATPDEALTPGHVFTGDLTPGHAEVEFSAGLSQAATWDGANTCSNLYCHGDGRAPGGPVAVDDALGCDGCHASQGSGQAAFGAMSGRHLKHMSESDITCADCHGTVVDPSGALFAGALHVDGTVEVALSSDWTSWDASNATCTGLCHDGFHFVDSW